jgi:hypothetical protein
MTHLLKELSPEAPQDDERLVLIPRNYAEERVVPICIRAIDNVGRSVHRGWIEAVWPVADRLRHLARRILDDVWRVSELTEASVHGLNERYGKDLGCTPSARILSDAKWRVLDLAAGGRRPRVGRDVDLRDETLAAMADPGDFARAYEDREFLQRLEERLKSTGQADTLIMLQMYLSNSEDEIASVFGIERNSRGRNRLSQRFRRSMQKALKLL